MNISSLRLPQSYKERLKHEVSFRYSRSSGPGGQNVNKVNSKVTLEWHPDTSSLPKEILSRFTTRFSGKLTDEGKLQLNSDRFRDQKRNKEDCLEKLFELLSQVLVPPKKRKRTKPSRGMIEKRLTSKKKVSLKKKARRFRED